MAKINEIKARQVFDSRGMPTVEAEIFLEGGANGRFITPSGASVGKKEALELRDNDPNKFNGRGVLKALSNIRGEITGELKNRSFSEQSELDHFLIELDSTPNKSRLGANAILAVSGAFFHAMAQYKKLPLYRSADEQKGPYLLPLPLVNVINGGVHANNNLDVQEFMIAPVGAKNFTEAMRMVAEVFYALKNILREGAFSTAVGDEGGFAPQLSSNEEALDILVSAVQKADYRLGHDIKFALDVAASELYDETSQTYRINNVSMGREDALRWYKKILDDYPIFSIEDPFFEEDFLGFKEMCQKFPALQVVGDDLFVTNERYIRQGIEHGYANAVLIKMNQIGTITETKKAITITQNAGFNAIISHRSGDSEDTTIADLAVMTHAGQIKTGSLSRSERTAKYNRLLRIEEEIKAGSFFSIQGSKHV